MDLATYNMWCNAIRLMPICVIFLAWLIVKPFLKTRTAILVVFLCGYFSGLLAVYWYWDFAFCNAPTEEIAEHATADGAPKMAAPFVMPIYVAFFMALVYPAVFVVAKLVSYLLKPPHQSRRDQEARKGVTEL